MERPIVINWREKNGEWRVKLIDRTKFTNLITSIKDGFSDNNEASSKLCDILSKVIVICIDKKRNSENPESPKIECFTYDGVKTIVIQNVHKIIWGIFDEYTK